MSIKLPSWMRLDLFKKPVKEEPVKLFKLLARLFDRLGVLKDEEPEYRGLINKLYTDLMEIEVKEHGTLVDTSFIEYNIETASVSQINIIITKLFERYEEYFRIKQLLLKRLYM